MSSPESAPSSVVTSPAPLLDGPARVKASGMSPHQEAELTLDYLLRRMRFKSDFPSLSSSVSRVQALAQSDTDSMQSLCDEVLRDVALTQKILRVVNTAHFRRAGTDPISTISRAVALIGAGGVRNMALSLMLLDHMQDKAHVQQLRTEFLRTVMAGTLASELSATAKEAEQAYLGAMFRNLGRLLVAYYLPEDAEQIRALCRSSADGPKPLSEPQAAQQVLGVSLDQLADKVGEIWGLPDTLRECMATPKGEVPRRSLKGRPEHHWWLASLSSAATEALMRSEPIALGEALMALQTHYAAALDLRDSELQDAAGRARKRMTELTEALNFAVPQQPEAERLIDPFYVDAPQGEATQGESTNNASAEGERATPALPATADGFAHPSYERTQVSAYDGSLSLPEQSSAVAQPMPLPDQTVANVLTNGIQDLTNTLLESFKLNDVLHMILETMYRAMQCQRVVFCLRDPRSNQLVGRMGIGEDIDVVKAAFKVPLTIAAGQTPDLFSVVCLKQADLLVDDVSVGGVADKLPRWFTQHVGAPSFLLLPLVLKRKGQPEVVLGLIYADHAQARGFQVRDRELSLLRTLRNQAVMAFKQTTGQ
jgi:HD-like signal output (HDOD) protein